MRRIGRWMLNALTALSLLLFVAACALIVRSYFVEDELWIKGASLYRVRSARAGLLIGIQTQFGPEGSVRFERYEYGRPSSYPRVFWYLGVEGRGGAGFDYGRTTDVWSKTPCYALVVPQVLIVLIASLLPGFAFWRAVGRRSRSDQRLCPTCKYDLTGNVSGVCPECGRKIAETK